MGNAQNSEIELTYTTHQVADTVKIGRSTLNKYSRSLEEYGYVFYKDDRGNRAYTEHDIVALRNLKELLDKSVSYDDAVSAISIKYKRNLKESSEVAIPTTQHEQYYIDIDALKTEIKLAFQQIAVVTESLRPDPLEERQRRITDIITQKRVESKLEAEAIALWLQKPPNERLKKVGWFRKEEDHLKREQFIKAYVVDHFEQRIKEEYGLD